MEDTDYPLKGKSIPADLTSGTSELVINISGDIEVSLYGKTITSGTYDIRDDPTFSVKLLKTGTAYLSYVSEGEWGPSSGTMDEWGSAGTTVEFPITTTLSPTTTTVTISFTAGN